jgi:CDP-paratose 2-epimerase
MLEAIEACERIAQRRLDWTLATDHRVGDHRWWISDLEPFRRDHPDWRLTYDADGILQEIHDQNFERWTAPPGKATVSSSAK